MPQPAGSSDQPGRLAVVRVPSRGVPGRLATAVAVGALGVVVVLGLSGRGSDEPPGSRAELRDPTAAPTATPTREGAPATADVTLPSLSCSDVAPTGGTPLADVAGALPGDDGGVPLPLGAITGVPNPDRLDFLFEGRGCFRDAHFMDPRTPGLGSGPWTAGRPFHVREGFVNNGAQPLGEGFDVIL